MKTFTYAQIGQIVRGRRLELGLSQEELARKAKASRVWLYSFEAGKEKAQIGHVLRVLDALDLTLEIKAAVLTPEELALEKHLREYNGK